MYCYERAIPPVVTYRTGRTGKEMLSCELLAILAAAAVGMQGITNVHKTPTLPKSPTDGRGQPSMYTQITASLVVTPPLTL